MALILLLLYLGTLLISLACPDCLYPTPASKSPNLPSKYPPKVKPPLAKPPPTVLKPPPHVPKPLTGKRPHISKLTLFFSWGYHYTYPILHPPISRPPRRPRLPFVHPPPIRPKLPIFATFPITPKPLIVHPPIIPTPPITPAPPVITPPPLPPVVPQPLPETPSPSPPEETLCPPPPPLLPSPETCPTLKLDACINELGGVAHVGIGSKVKDTCCPVLAGLLDLDAALCLCTTTKANRLNINIVFPIALQVLFNCGKTPPSGFQCPA